MRSIVSSSASLAILFAAIRPALSVGAWGQCGGINWTGGTTCDAGTACVLVNDYYAQCQPGASPTSPGGTTTIAPVPSPTNGACAGGKKFQFFGVNESGAEFGNTKIPGVLGTDYTWPSPTSVDYFVGQGFNTFRIPFQQERLSPPATGLAGPFDATYLNGLKSIVSYVTGKGGYAVIEPHNFMRYNNGIITSVSDFSAFWRNLANEFKSNSRVVFDLMNEPHDMDASVVFNLSQGAVNAIRAAGATTQLILVEGTSWTGAWTWISSGNGAAFTGLKDPNNNIAIEMHQYLDSDGSGTNATCVSSTIGAERLQAATNWLKTNNFKGFLGELGAGANSQCVEAVKGALCSMQQSGVWLGALWWAAGPWWGNYYQSVEPPNGPALSVIVPQALKPFM